MAITAGTFRLTAETVEVSDTVTGANQAAVLAWAQALGGEGRIERPKPTGDTVIMLRTQRGVVEVPAGNVVIFDGTWFTTLVEADFSALFTEVT